MKTILIADDSPSIRILIEKILRSAGHSVFTASDGREALKLAFENPIDIIVADHEMPHLTGLELFRILKTDPEKKNIPCIMISGLDRGKDEPVLELADTFIEKGPGMRSQLLAAIDKLC